MFGLRKGVSVYGMIEFSVWKILPKTPTDFLPGISTEKMHLFIAFYSTQDRKGKGGGEASEHENITIEEVPLAELAAMAGDGRITDMKTLVLIQTLRLRTPQLFGA